MKNNSQSTANLSSEKKRLLLAKLLHKKANEIEYSYPLSYGQQALWFLYQNAPESAAYNVAFTARICSDVDIEALQWSFQELIARHCVLRTTFSVKDGKPIQEVHGYQEVYFEETDASTWTSNELNEKVSQTYKRPFDLEQGPVLRVNIFTRSRQDHVFLLTIHHIVCDGWSLWMLIDELKVLYSARKRKTQASLPPLDFTFEDYVGWHQDMLASSEGDRLWNYWQRQLVGELPILNLPTDRLRPPVQTYQGASHNFKLDDKITQQLKELAQSQGTTLYVVLLSAFQILVSHYTGQEDILIGSPTTGRSQPEFASILGNFVNPVVLRTKVFGDSTFEEILIQARQTLLKAVAHQDYPFPLLVEKLQPNRDLSRSPLFQVSFVLQKPQQSVDGDILELVLAGKNKVQVDWGDLKLENFEMGQQEGQFDLSLEMAEVRESIVGFFKYNTDLFDAATITRIEGSFKTLLERIVENPQQTVRELPLLTEQERHQLLVEWNDTVTEYPQDKCIHQLFEQQVEKTPHAVAVVFEDQQLTYGELNQKANQLAHYLQKLGVKPEVLVGICVERSIEMVVGILGILKAGGAYVPLDPNYPEERITYMLLDAQVSVLLTQQRLVESLPEHQASIICLDSDWEVIARENENNLASKVTPENLAYVIYTSGSTGRPKGVLLAHKGLCNMTQAQKNLFDVEPTSRILQFASVSFDASVSEIFMAIANGAMLVLGKAESLILGSNLKQTASRHGVTHITLPPSALAVLTTDDLQTTGHIITAGETCSIDLVSKWSVDRHFFNAYGPTESTVCATVAKLSEGEEKITIGRPISNTQVYILDPHLQPVPIGVPGELYIGGAGLARGYLNRPELTKEKFIPNPLCNKSGTRLYKTGDLACYLPDGNIEFLGRLDHQVKIRGFRIELGEIEAVLNNHSQVKQAVVIIREDPLANKQLVAYIVSNSISFDTFEVRDFLQTKLPDYMIPNAFVFLECLPLTPNGKIDRKALPTPELQRIERKNSFIKPQTDLEEIISQIWQNVLGIEQVSIHDNFFDIGGHSLLATKVQSQLSKQLNQELSALELFKFPTISALAQHLNKSTNKIKPENLEDNRSKKRISRQSERQERRLSRQNKRIEKL